MNFRRRRPEENITSQEPAETEEEPQEEETEPDKPSFPEIDNSFDDVLFIGDSRTMVFQEYGHLGKCGCICRFRVECLHGHDEEAAGVGRG